MTAFELGTLIGEFVSMEVDDVNRVEYSKKQQQQTEFTVILENGNKFAICIEKH